MDHISTIRAFNRFYTQRMGLFSPDYGGSGMNLTELRVFYEIGVQNGSTARLIANALDLDEGYVSRILKNFERSGWILRKPSEHDARQKELHLTESGHQKFSELVDRMALEVHKRLDGADAGRVARALEQAVRSFDLPCPVEFRDLTPGDAGWVVNRHAETYYTDYKFDYRMEMLVMQILAAFLPVQGIDGNRAFIARSGETRLGSIFCMNTEEPGVAKLRLFFLEPEARGMGLGKRLMTICLNHARASGFKRMTLMTHETQVVARALYARFGFTLTERISGYHFGSESVQETWDLTL